MSITLDKFRAKLVIKVLHADSSYATQRYIHAALKGMLQKNVNGYIISRFIDHVSNQLNTCKNTSSSLQQWNNIRAAIYELHHFRESISKRPGFHTLAVNNL